ncbi:MAG: putative histidine kinase [Candidatus Saccharibacteria bacterium]|nr:putative histidine kinase [Candidatus Saccharibacteria bacterium]
MTSLSPKPKIKELQVRTLTRWPRLSYATLPIIIMVLVVIVCIAGYGLTTARNEVSRGIGVERRLRENQIRIIAVFDSYAHLLWGSTGRVQTAPIDHDSWEQFMGIYHLSKNFSGMEAVGLINSNGSDNAVVAYVSPETSVTNRAVGTDLAAIPDLNSTMKQAAASGETTISNPLPNLFSTKEDIKTTRTGFLMLAPFYDISLPTTTTQERIQSVHGYTAATFRGDIFFDRVFKDVDLSHTQMNVYLGDVSKANLLYEVNQTTSNNFKEASQKVDVYGKTFTLTYKFDRNDILSPSLNYMPEILVVSGLFVGMLIAGIGGYMLRHRYRRLTLEKEQAVNFAKDELLSLASHQLRTPATGVKQYLGMVLQGFAGKLNKQQQTYLERANASNNRQLQVINDILHMAKLEAGRIVLAEHEFDIAQMVHDVIDEQRSEAEKNSITLTLKAPSKGLIVGDSHMLRMVVENLVSNAIKYTPEEGAVSVRLMRRANRWIVIVKDTGVGIAKKDFEKLFQQFSRINNPRSDFVTGTGVGLYLAHHLTVLHGGTIAVQSTQNKGSTFTVRLPRKL